MKKDKKTSPITLWSQGTQSPDFFKKLFVFIAFFILFTLCLILTWKNYVDKKANQSTTFPQVFSHKAIEKRASLQNEISSFENRLHALQHNPISQEPATQTLHKVIAFELFKAVLEGWISIETLKTFLQKNPEPWATTLLTPLLSIKEIKSYPQLEALLGLPSFPQPLSMGSRVKRILTSFIHIRKLDENSQDKQGNIEDIQQSLRAHDIQKALELFEKLPLQEQTPLSSWKTGAQDRSLLEMSLKKLLLELMEDEYP
jgi:hypothetical protein